MRVRHFTHSFVVLLISLAVYQILRYIYAPHWQEMTDVSFGILSGTPDWLAYQNRLLAPWLISLISLAGFSAVSSLKIFVLLAVIAEFFLLFFLLTKSGVEDREAFGGVLAFSLLFLFIQGFSLYPWDFLDLLFFSLFGWGVFQRKSPFFFIVLFLVAIANRESGLFIGLYLLLDGFEFDPAASLGKKLRVISKQKLIAGVVLIGLGILYVGAVRNLLFISQPGGFLDNKHAALGNHINVIKNLHILLVDNFTNANVLHSVFLLGSLGYALSFLRHEWKAVLVYLVMTSSVLVFGLVNESRLYAFLLPFLIFFYFSGRSAGEKAAPSQQL
jgi:hypothetical protein